METCENKVFVVLYDFFTSVTTYYTVLESHIMVDRDERQAVLAQKETCN